MNRTYLFVPADRPDRCEKALASNADVVVIDLEDGVPADRKSEARSCLQTLLANARRSVAVRISGQETPWMAGDLALCGHAAVRWIMVAKAEQVSTMAAVARQASRAALLPLIETARGFANRDALAASANVERLVFGSIDFQLDLGIHGDGDELLAFRSAIVLASRLAGLFAPVDGVSAAIDDLDALRHACERARRLGFGAKLCVHPRQLAVVDETFRPGSAELAWARKVEAAARESGGAAVMLEGSMIDLPLVLRARQLLAQAGE